MGDPDQMRRDELLAARDQVSSQLERAQYGGYSVQPGAGSAGKRPVKEQVKGDLQAILDEINAELAELDSKNA